MLMSIEYPFISELRKALADKNVIIINPLSHVLELERSGTNAYFANDEHMNSEGQAILAQSILDQLRRRI